MKLRQDLNEQICRYCFYAADWLKQDYDPSFAHWFNATIEDILQLKVYRSRILHALVCTIQPGSELSKFDAAMFDIPYVGKKTRAVLFRLLDIDTKAPKTEPYTAGWQHHTLGTIPKGATVLAETIDGVVYAVGPDWFLLDWCGSTKPVRKETYIGDHSGL